MLSSNHNLFGDENGENFALTEAVKSIQTVVVKFISC